MGFELWVLGFKKDTGRKKNLGVGLVKQKCIWFKTCQCLLFGCLPHLDAPLSDFCTVCWHARVKPSSSLSFNPPLKTHNAKLRFAPPLLLSSCFQFQV